jgi:hypothetical protein
MRLAQLRRRIAVAGTIGVTALIATMGIGAGVASAAPTDPAGGNTPVYPSYNNGVVSGIRDAGSDTTFYMMQQLGDLYTGAGLYGCTLNTGSSPSLYNTNTAFVDSSGTAEDYCQKNQNVSTTDTNDNWSRTEVSAGVDDVGSTAGQSQLCGDSVLNTPAALPVDFARSSKPAGTYCATLQEAGYAKDAVVPLVQQISPASLYGAVPNTSPYYSVNGGSIGDVAEGWLPGDAVTATSGTAFTNLANTDNGGGSSSTAYRLYCDSGNTSALPAITDWGQLTNRGPNLRLPNVTLTGGSATATLSFALPTNVTGGSTEILTDLTNSGALTSGTYISSVSGTTVTLSQPAASSSTGTNGDILSVAIGSTEAVGSGGAIGVPIRVIGVNPAAGTESTWQSFAKSGSSAGGCSSNANGSAASDPNSSTATGDNSGAHIVLENNASQVGDYDAADFPGDYADQAVELASSILYESNGIYSSNPYAAGSTVNGTYYGFSKISLNGKLPTTNNYLNNIYATSRTLFNIYNTATLRASTAGFLNWLCDDNHAIAKGKDNSTGINFDTEVNSIITSFGFTRLDDDSAVATSSNTPPDNVSGGGINTSCAGGLSGSAGNDTPPISGPVAFPES